MIRQDNKNGKLIKISKQVSKLTNKTLFNVVLDILNCLKKYNISYEEYLENEVYFMNEKQREGFISENTNLNYVSKCNDENYKYIFDNRYEFNKVFKNFIDRDYFLLNKDNYNDFINFLIGKSKIIAKPIDKNSNFKIEAIRINAKTDRKKLFNNLLKKELLLIEDFIYQTSELNNICESCVNSVQITTYLDESGNVTILNRIFKVGGGNLLNSLNNGGYYTLLDEFGKVLYPFVSNDGRKSNVHPKSKINFNEYEFKDIKKIEEFVSYIAKEFKEVKYVTWDVSLTDNGPVLIAADYIPRIFNIKPSVISDFVGFKKKYEKRIEKGEEYEGSR